MNTINVLKKELAEKEADLDKLTLELSDTYEELVLLYNFNDAIHSTFDPDEIAQLLLELAIDVLSVERGLYLAPSEDEKEFTVKFHRGIDEEKRADYKVHLGEGAIGKSIESAQPSIISDVNTKSELKESSWGWKHLLSVPLVVKDKVIDVLVLADKISGDAFLSNDRKLIASIASIAAYVIENARMYQELDVAYERLKSTQDMLIQTEKLATVGQISAGVAHEIKNPLTAIIGYAQLILMTMPEGSQNKKEIGIIEQEALRCSDIANNLLGFSRQQREETAPLDINQCLAETLAIIEYQVRKNNIKVIKKFDASLPCIEGNANQLMQVFLNLINNASHAMPDGGKITMRTAFDAVDSTVIVEIADTGLGIPKENIPHLFEPFFTTKEKGKGTGLGLYVSYGIIKEHNGTILVNSITAQSAVIRQSSDFIGEATQQFMEKDMPGTTFTIKLPVQQPE